MIARFADRKPYDAWDAAVLDDYCRWGIVPAPDGVGFELACPPMIEASAYLGSMTRNPYDWLSDVTCPTLVVRGRSGVRTATLDFSISPTWPGLADSFADGRDLQWDDCSHFLPMEAPGRVAALLVQELAMLGHG